MSDFGDGPNVGIGTSIISVATFNTGSGSSDPHPGNDLLMETGDYLLQETGDSILLE